MHAIAEELESESKPESAEAIRKAIAAVTDHPASDADVARIRAWWSGRPWSPSALTMPRCQAQPSVFGTTNSSSRTTASRRATEIEFRREKRQATPSRSSVSPHNRRMSADSFVNRYRGYSYQWSPSARCARTRLIPR